MVVLSLGAQSTACAQTWADVDVIQHGTYQAVNEDGSSAYPPGQFPIRLIGVVLNNSEDWLDPASNYMEGPMWAMGGEAEIYVQTVDPTDFGGTAAWMGQNYGNHFWHFPDWDYNYPKAEWYAELDRLHLYRPETPYGNDELVRAGDLVELRARGGLNYKGKQNVNEQHDNDPPFDFEIVILQKDLGLPCARPITLEKLKDAADVDIFDPTRATGGERYQSTRAAIRNVGFRGFNPADWHSNTVPDLVLEDAATTRSFPIHLGLNESFDVEDAPEAPFDVAGVMDQKSSSMSQCIDGYRMLAMNAADFHEVSHWTSTAGADWNTGSSWHRGSVPGDGSSLIFDGATTLLASNNDLAGRELFGLAFVQRDGWQIGGNMLTIGGYIVAESNASINVDLTLSTNQAWDVAETKTLTLGGQVGGDANLLKIGAGTVILNDDVALGGNATIEQGTVNVGSGATVQVRKLHNAGAIGVGNGATVQLSHEWVTGAVTADPNDSYSALASLGFGTGATLDVNKSGIVLSGTDYATVVGMLDNALTAGATAGRIVSSAATAANAADPDHPRSIAVVDDGTGNVTARYAASGDTDLDGKIKLTDYITLKSNYDPMATDKTWSQGDWHYDGKVKLTDYVQLKHNYSPVFTYDEASEGLVLQAAAAPGEVECIVNMVTGEISLEGHAAQFEGIEIISPASGLLVDQDTGPFFGGETIVGENLFYAELAPLTGEPFELDGTQSLGPIYNPVLNTMDLEVNIGLDRVVPTYVVAEPGTMALALAAWGSALLVGWRRRRRVGGRP